VAVVPGPEGVTDATNRIQNGFRTIVAILALAIFGALFFSSHAEFIDENPHTKFVHLASWQNTPNVYLRISRIRKITGDAPAYRPPKPGEPGVPPPGMTLTRTLVRTRVLVTPRKNL